MRWISYFILAYLVVGLQSGLGHAMEIHHAPPNLVLLVVIFITVNAPRDAALMGALLLGLMQDLTTGQPLGLFALSYGLVAMFVQSTHNAIYREHPLTHFTLTLIGGMMTAIVVAVHGWIHPARIVSSQGVTIAALHVSLATLFGTALYSAILAPIVIGCLQRGKKFFQFRSPRRRMPGFRA